MITAHSSTIKLGMPFLLKDAPSRWNLDRMEYMVPWTRPSPNPRRHLDRFSNFAQIIAERPYTLKWTAIPLTIVHCHGSTWIPM